MYELPEDVKASVRQYEDRISRKQRELDRAERSETEKTAEASRLWETMNFRERHLWGWFGGDKKKVARHKELTGLTQSFNEAASGLSADIAQLNQSADGELHSTLKDISAEYQELMVPYEAAKELKAAVDSFMGKINEALSEIDDAQGMETMDLFTKSTAISILSSMENSEASTAINHVKDAAPDFQDAVTKYNGVLKGTKAPQVASELNDGIDLVFDLVFDGFDFMSLFTLNALGNAERELKDARSKVSEVDDVASQHLDKTGAAVKSYIQQMRLSC